MPAIRQRGIGPIVSRKAILLAPLALMFLAPFATAAIFGVAAGRALTPAAFPAAPENVPGPDAAYPDRSTPATLGGGGTR